MEWQNVTGYSQGDKERKPSAWRIKLGKVSLSVVSGHIYYPGRWIMRFTPFVDMLELNVATETEAQAKAIKIAKAMLQEAIDAIEE